DIAYNFGDWYGIDHFGGFLASLTTNVNLVLGNKQARRMYAINFYVARKPSAPEQVEVFAGRSGIKVFRKPDAFPRAWIVHEASSIQHDGQVGVLLDSES